MWKAAIPKGKDHSKIQDLFISESGDKPNHPENYTFSKQKFGNKKLTYRVPFDLGSWFEKWPAMNYMQ